MNRKLIKRYILISIPFGCGIILISMGIYNLVSSLLLFVGGYMFVKNIGDYRVIRRNIRKSNGYKKIDRINGDRFDSISNYDKIMINSYDDLGLCDIDMGISNDMDKCSNIECCKSQHRYKNSDSVNGFKNTRRYVKVRRRYWWYRF